MNKAVEAIKTGGKVTIEEVFNVVNDYVHTMIGLRTPDKESMSK